MTYGIRTLNHMRKTLTMSKRQEMDFVSGDEEYFEDVNSPTDNSEDSVEVKVSAISCRNKRKCTEPRKVPEKFTGPLKKRMCLKVQSDKKLTEKLSADSAPFRPWSPPATTKTTDVPKTGFALPHIPILNPYGFPKPSAYFRPPSPVKYPDEPVALIKKCQTEEDVPSTSRGDAPRVPVHPYVPTMSPLETERLILNSAEAFPALKRPESASGKREQRNYKNMTRERRIEANARERTRVHTISAAFDTLRRSIPSYSHNQKLSKLSVLRIACSYIMTLSNIVQNDDPAKTAEGVDLITKTIQKEGKLRKKKDDND